MLPVDFQTVGLAIGSVRPTDVGAFVPIQAEPLEIGDELIFKAGFAAFDVSVFDPQHHSAALPPGKKPVEQRRARVAHVELPGRRRSKANPDRRI